MGPKLVTIPGTTHNAIDGTHYDTVVGFRTIYAPQFAKFTDVASCDANSHGSAFSPEFNTDTGITNTYVLPRSRGTHLSIPAVYFMLLILP